MDLFDNTSGNVGKMQYHLRVKPGDVADYVLLPGDPGRITLIAEHLNEPTEVAHHREYRTVTGNYHDIRVSGTSTGIGCPSASIAVEELANVGVSHFIRVGSSAAFVPGIRKGDVLINVASMREDGTTAALVDDGFPAVADHFLTAALIEAGQELSRERGFGLFIGINASADAFYAETEDRVKNRIRQRIMNIEMESAAIFTIAHLRGLKAASVCAVSYNYTEPDEIDYEGVNQALFKGWHNAIDVALEGIRKYEAKKQEA